MALVGIIPTILAAMLLCFANQVDARAPYIIGGQDASPGAWPWQGSLQFMWQHICGCALISDRWLVTAGHCLDTEQLNPAYMTVLMGAHDMYTRRFGAPKYYAVKRVHRHPQYLETLAVNGHIKNDIGLIELTHSVRINVYVQPIVMTSQGSRKHGSNCFISGWGLTENVFPEYPWLGSPDTPNVLQESPVNEVPEHVCNSQYYGYAGSVDDEQQICVSYHREAGSCSGDSGGPLVCSPDSDSDDWKLIGVTSFGEGHCRTEFPSVYTRISHFRKWIAKVSGV